MDKEKILKAVRQKWHVAYREMARMDSDDYQKKCKPEDNKMTALSSERKSYEPGILYERKIFFKYEGYWC